MELANIPGFPEYQVSPTGDVLNLRTGKFMALSKTMQGDLKVTIVNEEERVTRSIRVLVAEAYVDPPESGTPSDTVIVLNNNKTDIRPDNLAWRPEWFAQRYARQFKASYPDYYYNRPILNEKTNVRYSSILECCMKEGLLFDDVSRSCKVGGRIFPSGASYQFA